MSAKFLLIWATNNAREIFATVPGLNIWESDGGGLQIGIGARGLSPNRTEHFNTRQNGYDMSADALGYPETYYTPPADAIKYVKLYEVLHHYNLDLNLEAWSILNCGRQV